MRIPPIKLSSSSSSLRGVTYKVEDASTGALPIEVVGVSTQLCLPPSSHSEEGKINIPYISPLRDLEENCYELVVASGKIKIQYNSLLRDLETTCYKLFAASDTDGGLDLFSRRNYLKKVLTAEVKLKDERTRYQLHPTIFGKFLTGWVANYLMYRFILSGEKSLFY